MAIEDSQVVLAALGAIAGDERQSAVRALAELLNGRAASRRGGGAERLSGLLGQAAGLVLTPV
jgi:hypothetical protein